MEKVKVLMVDDEERFRKTTAKLLSKRGYETTVASSGEEALEILKQNIHDVVVLDIRMPGMDGHEALAKIKEIDAKIEVIMLTGHGQMESARDSLTKGAFDYLAKPCDLDRLAARIQDAYNISHKTKQQEKKAGQVMIPIEDYTVLSPNSSIKEAIDSLNQSFQLLVSTEKIMQTGHRSILVMDRGELVGILSIMDLIQALRPGYLSAPKPSMAYNVHYSPMFWTGLFTTQAKALARKKIEDVMSPPPLAVDAESNLMEVANLLYEEEARRLVVKKNDRIVGVLREQEIFFELARTILETGKAAR